MLVGNTKFRGEYLLLKEPSSGIQNAGLHMPYIRSTLGDLKIALQDTLDIYHNHTLVQGIFCLLWQNTFISGNLRASGEATRSAFVDGAYQRGLRVPIAFCVLDDARGIYPNITCLVRFLDFARYLDYVLEVQDDIGVKVS
jgi:hypothetical protein